MTGSPTYVADPSFQIGAGATGPYDCLAHATSDAIDHATAGHKDPNGRTIRLLSNEPVPVASSPGLNLWQVRDVAWESYGVWLDIHTGLSWSTYENNRRGGSGALIQVGYAPVADSKYDAGRGFRDNHGMFESQHASYDPLADGRAAGVYRSNGPVLYAREVIKRAAGRLVISGSGATVGYGKVWCAFTRDVAPNFRVVIKPYAGETRRAYRAYHVVGDHIDVSDPYDVAWTKGGFASECDPPRAFKWNGRLIQLVRITGTAHHGQWVAFHHAKEIA